MSEDQRIKQLEKDLELKSIECNEWRVKYIDLLEIHESFLSGNISNTESPLHNLLNTFTSEIVRVTKDTGTFTPAVVPELTGTWQTILEAVNTHCSNVASLQQDLTKVISAVAMGDLTKKLPMDGHGCTLELQQTTNVMIDQLHCMASELTRIAIEVGKEGKLGGSFCVKGIGGVWKKLVDSIATMVAENTYFVRSFAEVFAGVTNGDFSRKVRINCEGELREYKDLVNEMVDCMDDFTYTIMSLLDSSNREIETERLIRKRQFQGMWNELFKAVNQSVI